MASPSNSARRSRSWVATVCDALVSTFFPADCRTCDQLLKHASRVPICQACIDSFELLTGTLCVICGRPLATGTENPAPAEAQNLLCPDCRDLPGRRERVYAFDRARSYASYDGALARAILFLKFERPEPLGEWFAERLAELFRDQALAADVVVPVPLHRDRRKERGYNQAELISKPLAKRLKLPHRPVLLVRTKPRPDKHVLSLKERWESVRGAFATRPGSAIDNARVLLIDDVMTTGATLDACARALHEAGARLVIAMTVARALRDMDTPVRVS